MFPNAHFSVNVEQDLDCHLFNRLHLPASPLCPWFSLISPHSFLQTTDLLCCSEGPAQQHWTYSIMHDCEKALTDIEETDRKGEMQREKQDGKQMGELEKKSHICMLVSWGTTNCNSWARKHMTKEVTYGAKFIFPFFLSFLRTSVRTRAMGVKPKG